jgi:hypothetical protein
VSARKAVSFAFLWLKFFQYCVPFLRRTMRKILTLSMSIFLSLGLLQPVQAVDVTKGRTGIVFSDSDIFGNIQGVVWGQRKGEDSSQVFVSFKRGNAAWTNPRNLGLVEWSTWVNPQITIRPDGSMLVAWTSDENIQIRELAPNASTWSAAATLPNSTISGVWMRELDVVSNGTAVTVVGVRSGTGDDVEVASWTRSTDQSEWAYNTIDEVMDSATYGNCGQADFFECDYNFSEIRALTTPTGEQAVAWLAWRQPGGYETELKGSTFAIFTARRSSSQGEWETARRIDTMKPTAKVAGYAFFIESFALTANGSAAIAWRKGYNNSPTDGYLAVSESTTSAFARTDTTAINRFAEVNNIKLGVAGNNIWMAVEGSVKRGGDFSIRVGRVGNFAKAKVAAISDSFYLIGLGAKANRPSLLLRGSGTVGGRSVFSSTIANNANVEKPKSIKVLPTSRGIVLDVMTKQSSQNTLLVLSGSRGNSFGLGLEAFLL